MNEFTRLENNCIEIHVLASGTSIEDYGVDVRANCDSGYSVQTPITEFEALENSLTELQSSIEESEEDFSELDHEVQDTLSLLSEIMKEARVTEESTFFDVVWELSSLDPESFYKQVSTFVRQNPDKDFDSFVKSKIA